MNPLAPLFAPLFSHPVDQVFTWLLALGAVVAGWKLLAVKESGAAPGAVPPPDRLLAAARSYWRVCGVSTAVFAIGVFIFALGLRSVLLTFWALAYMVAVVATAHVLPWIGLALLAWWLVRGRRTPAGPRGAALVAVGLLLLAANVVLFFVIERLAEWQNHTH